MTVLSVKQGGSIRAHGGSGGASVDVPYTVVIDHETPPDDRAAEVFNAAGLPLLYSAFPGDSTLYLKDKDIDLRSDSNTLYDVICKYSTRSSDNTDESPYVSPLDKPIKISWRTTSSYEPFDKNLDDDDKPVTNSAGESPDPPLTKKVSDRVLKISRNEAVFNSVSIDNAFLDRINSSDFFGYGQYHVRCEGIDAVRKRWGDMIYHAIDYIFQIRINDTWKHRFVDEGFRTWDSEKNEYTEIKDSEGNPIREPRLLDGSGGLLAKEATPIFKTARGYYTADLNILNFS